MHTLPRPSLGDVGALAVCLAFALLTAGCGNEAPPAADAARPVTVMTLREETPRPAFVATGVAEPYREAGVGFEVAGRLTQLIDVGRSVAVTTSQDDGGALEHVGDVIAEIDDTTYRQRVRAAELRLASAQAGLQAQRIDLDEVAQATLARAKAQREASRAEVAAAQASIESADSSRKTALADLERSKKLLADRQISKAEFDQAQNAYATAAAGLARAEAGLEAARRQVEGFDAAVDEAVAAARLKEENLKRTEAEIQELAFAVTQARTDLDRCRLRAPFPGRITHVHVSQGDFVQPGQPVVTLTLIDPIKIAVTVSAEREREIQSGNHASVYPIDLESFGFDLPYLTGTVFEKSAVADAATRTHRIDVMVRNARRPQRPGQPIVPDGDPSTVQFRQLLPAVQRHFGEGGPLFVCRDCITADGVVYRVRGAKFGHPRSQSLFSRRLALDRIRVARAGASPADFMQILNWNFQRVDNRGGEGEPRLEHGDILVNVKGLDLTALEDGIVMQRYDWAIRPGDLVPVSLDPAQGEPGLYVVDDALRPRDGTVSLFVVEGDRVREVAVAIKASHGRLRRIEGAGLDAGARVVVKGVHYCFDGATVVVVGEAPRPPGLGESDGEPAR